jgi:hypothetical protein
MKKSFLLLLVAILFNSCTQSISSNNVAIQGLKNSVFWQATEYNAKLGTNGSITITGVNIDDTIVITLNSTNKGTYTLGSNNSIKATYAITQNSAVSLFDTTLSRLVPLETNGIVKGKGEIEITNYDGTIVSGKFEFDAVNADPASDQVYVNFKKGVFNNIPVTK